MLNVEYSHTDLTDLTDFDSYGIFPVRLGEYRCLQREDLCKSVKSVGDKREEAGRTSKHPFRAMI